MESNQACLQKIIVEDDNNINIYVFGSQLYGTANEKSDTDLIVIQKEFKEIYDFTRDSYILKDLYKLSESYKYQELWDVIDAKYRGEFNRRKSLFKSLFPIDKQTERANEIKNILERYKCYDVELYQELKSLL